MEPRVDVWSLSVPCFFRISRGVIRSSDHVLVRIRSSEGEGVGCSPLYARSPYQLPKLVRERIRPFEHDLLERPASDARALARQRLAMFPDVLNAVDGALWDLEGRAQEVPVRTLLGGGPESVLITEQLFPLSIEKSIQELRALESRGVRRVKVKLVGNQHEDLSRLEALVSSAEHELEWRVDANRGYSIEQALEVAPRLADLGVRQWEEPIRGTFEEVADLRRRTPLAVILDESVRTRDDLARALAAGCIDILNVKLGRLGGITAAIDYVTQCRDHGIDVLIGCAEDLGPGMAAVLHAASAYDAWETEGLGAPRLGVDIATPTPRVVDGLVQLPDGPGWGLSATPILTYLPGAGREASLVHAADWNGVFKLRNWVDRQRLRPRRALSRARRVMST